MQIRVFDATAASGFRTVRESYELNPSASSTSCQSVAESTNLYRSSPLSTLRPPPFVRHVGMQLRNDSSSSSSSPSPSFALRTTSSGNERSFLTYSRLRRARPLRVMNIKREVGESLLDFSWDRWTSAWLKITRIRSYWCNKKIHIGG